MNSIMGQEHEPVAMQELYLLLDERGFKSRGGPLKALVSLLPLLNWSSDIFLLTSLVVSPRSSLSALIKSLHSFLKAYSFFRIHLRPFHTAQPRYLDRLIAFYKTMITILADYQKEAFEQQGSPRLVLSPIFSIKKQNHLRPLGSLIKFLEDNLVVPSLYMAISEHEASKEIKKSRERIYPLYERGSGLYAWMVSLGRHRLLERLLSGADPVEKKGAFACCDHMIVGPSGRLYRCFKAYEEGLFWGELDRLNSVEEIIRAYGLAAHPTVPCSSCQEEAMKSMERFAGRRADPDEQRELCYRIALQAMKELDLQKAIGLFDRAEKISDSERRVEEICLQRGICRYKKGELQEAREDFRVLVEKRPPVPIGIYYMALCYLEDGGYKEAMRLLNKCLELRPSGWLKEDALFYLAVSHILLGQYEEALYSLEKIEGLGGRRLAPVRFYTGMALLGIGDTEAAALQFQKALDAGPSEEDLCQVLFYNGYVNKELGRYRKALGFLREALHREADRADIHSLMGFCYFRIEAYDKAIDCFQKAVGINPDSAMDYANLGSSLARKGRSMEALEMYRKALEIDPTFKYAEEHLREIQQQLNRTKR